MSERETKEFEMLRQSHTGLCVRVAMMEMVLRDALELLAATHPEEERIMRKLALLPVNNKGTGHP